ncbi:MAG TPA: sugar phosphate isomerase/epimerase [Bryobacteraceae bacterium]
MKLGIVADEINRDFAKAVQIGTRLGLRRYEIRNLTSGRAPMCDPKELQAVEEAAEREGLEITALSPGLFKYVEDEVGFQREMKDLYPRAAELAHRWKLPGLITFGFHKPGATEENVASLPKHAVPQQVADWLARAGEKAGGDGLLLMIEPEPICWMDTSRVAADVIERSGASWLRINYDPGNVAWLEQRDPINEFEVAARWIANVHVKDLLPLKPGATRPEFVPAGCGIIDFRQHFAALKRVGYQGPVSLEPHMNGNAETIERCRDAVTLIN